MIPTWKLASAGLAFVTDADAMIAELKSVSRAGEKVMRKQIVPRALTDLVRGTMLVNSM